MLQRRSSAFDLNAILADSAIRLAPLAVRTPDSSSLRGQSTVRRNLADFQLAKTFCTGRGAS
jgi:hypothetical protein